MRNGRRKSKRGKQEHHQHLEHRCRTHLSAANRPGIGTSKEVEGGEEEEDEEEENNDDEGATAVST